VQINYVLLFLILVFFSCKEEKEIKADDCKIDANLVNIFFQENKYEVIDIRYIDKFKDENGCIEIDSFIEYELIKKKIFDNGSHAFEDTLFSKIGLQNFEELAFNEENKGDEIIRLIKSDFAFGLGNLLVIEGHNKNQSIHLKSFNVKFDRKCDFPIYNSPNGLTFSSKCLEIKDSINQKIQIKDWKELKEIIQETEFMYTAYFERGQSICDGSVYSISYSDGKRIEDRIHKMERACPGEKTAVFMVADKLIKIKNGS